MSDRPWEEVEADLIAQRGLGYEDIAELDGRHTKGIAIYVARLERELAEARAEVELLREPNATTQETA